LSLGEAALRPLLTLKQILWRIRGFQARHSRRKRWRPSVGLAVVGTLIITALILTLFSVDPSHFGGGVRDQRSVLDGGLTVIDGDTVRWKGRRVRLVGFDAPETGKRANCSSERLSGEKATARLNVLISNGDAKLDMVRCACPRGTEGTDECNFGRACGVLTVNGRDVGQTLVLEGLARPYLCGQFSCPPRGSWC
jgi:hypothetical protein